jgi:hypothetical protein
LIEDFDRHHHFKLEDIPELVELYSNFNYFPNGLKDMYHPAPFPGARELPGSTKNLDLIPVNVISPSHSVIVSGVLTLFLLCSYANSGDFKILIAMLQLKILELFLMVMQCIHMKILLFVKGLLRRLLPGIL